MVPKQMKKGCHTVDGCNGGQFSILRQIGCCQVQPIIPENENFHIVHQGYAQTVLGEIGKELLVYSLTGESAENSRDFRK